MRLSHYLVETRPAVRVANDNRPSHGPTFWPWAVAIGVAPVVSAMIILSLLF